MLKTVKQKQAIVKSETKKELDYLRALREKQCFAIVNRGKLFYDQLTIEQEEELRIWYFKWLNVTETFEIPARPSFLNEKINQGDVELL